MLSNFDRGKISEVSVSAKNWPNTFNLGLLHVRKTHTLIGFEYPLNPEALISNVPFLLPPTTPTKRRAHEFLRTKRMARRGRKV